MELEAEFITVDNDSLVVAFSNKPTPMELRVLRKQMPAKLVTSMTTGKQAFATDSGAPKTFDVLRVCLIKAISAQEVRRIVDTIRHALVSIRIWVTISNLYLRFEKCCRNKHNSIGVAMTFLPGMGPDSVTLLEKQLQGSVSKLDFNSLYGRRTVVAGHLRIIATELNVKIAVLQLEFVDSRCPCNSLAR